MSTQRVVPASSRVKDKVTMDELNNLYNQISILLDAIRTLQDKVNKLEGK